MKKTLSMLLALCLLTAMLPLAQADDFDTEIVILPEGETQQDTVEEISGDIPLIEETLSEGAPQTTAEDADGSAAEKTDQSGSIELSDQTAILCEMGRFCCIQLLTRCDIYAIIKHGFETCISNVPRPCLYGRKFLRKNADQKQKGER